MTEDKILKQLGKTGNTPFAFANLEVELKGGLFMPVQAQNELRRAGLEALEQAVLDQWRRPAPSAGLIAPAASAPTPPIPFSLYVSTEEPEQFEAAVREADVAGIYLDAAGLPRSGGQLPCSPAIRRENNVFWRCLIFTEATRKHFSRRTANGCGRRDLTAHWCAARRK